MQHKDSSRAGRGNRRPRQDSRYPKADTTEQNLHENLCKQLGHDFSECILTPKDTAHINDFIDKIKAYVWNNYKGWTASQLRNIFVHVKRAQSVDDLYRLRPHIAYASGRAEGHKRSLQEFLYLLDTLIKKITTPEQMKEFQLFFESIIAYHKYFGGKP